MSGINIPCSSSAIAPGSSTRRQWIAATAGGVLLAPLLAVAAMPDLYQFKIDTRALNLPANVTAILIISSDPSMLSYQGPLIKNLTVATVGRFPASALAQTGVTIDLRAQATSGVYGAGSSKATGKLLGNHRLGLMTTKQVGWVSINAVLNADEKTLTYQITASGL